jgi:hypothetical protein
MGMFLKAMKLDFQNRRQHKMYREAMLPFLQIKPYAWVDLLFPKAPQICSECVLHQRQVMDFVEVLFYTMSFCCSFHKFIDFIFSSPNGWR